MELFRRNRDVHRFITSITKDDLSHTGYNITAIQKPFMGIPSPIIEMSGKSTSVIDSTHCINKANCKVRK
jgi:hypothetical protein